jgi:branched-chain amino acid transport system substrate-binding protein
MSVVPAVAQANRILIGTNAGPAPLAGAQCSRNFVSTALQNDEAAEAMGLLMNQDQVTNVYLIAPNYQAGKDYLAGFQRTFNGRVIDQALVKLGETDFQADLSRIRASSPEAVFGFLPGAMGIAFAKQWSASGMSERVKLYTVYTIDNLTLPAIGKAAVGTYHTNIWNPDSQNPRNLEFVKRFTAKHGRAPSMFAVTTYDAVTLIVDAVKAVGGNVDDTTALMRAMRTGGLRSIRGDLKYNVNGFLVQPYYSREVVLSPQGAPTIRGKQQVMFKKDSYGESCPAAQRWE